MSPDERYQRYIGYVVIMMVPCESGVLFGAGVDTFKFLECGVLSNRLSAGGSCSILPMSAVASPEFETDSRCYYEL